MSIQYSIVVPIKDEEENIPKLIFEIETVMESTGHSWELICIDDGSKDSSNQLLQSLQKEKKFLKLITFDRNYGQSSAFDAGFKKAKGDWIITLDGDLQNDPKDIPLLLAKTPDYDLVCGWRHMRRDTFSKRMTSKISNFIRSRLCQDHIHDTGCSLKVYRKKALDQIQLYHGMHRFLPALFRLNGYKILEVKVSHRARTLGKSKYHFFNRSIGPIVDMFAVYWMRKKRLKYQIKQER